MELQLPSAQKEALFHHTYIKALLENKQNLTQWKEYKQKYEEVIKNLKYYTEKHQHSVFFPVGNKAFIKGKLVHTNDVCVTLGCGWFLKTSSKKAIEICERRIKSADELIEKWEKENKLLENMRNLSKENDAFGNEETKEIVEPFDEQKEQQWQVEHREKEKKYRQQLKELKEKTESPTLSTEKDIWEYLEALELQEEVEDELIRLGCDSELDSDDEDSSECDIPRAKIMDNKKLIEEIPKENGNIDKVTHSSIIIPSKNVVSNKKSVSFNLPPDDEKETMLKDPKTGHENKAVISDIVYENVSKDTSLIDNNKNKRPISQFKMNRKVN